MFAEDRMRQGFYKHVVKLSFGELIFTDALNICIPLL
jgi:hypothetical protein